ncbi:hypothetical protein [Methylobacterium fujisawaense]|uniref:hypothetical protein n=1 Tax=Methylobacterium fujisawaense TaxID=107400 RepID=UPI002446DF54|nr:hypothetical protein [Methylobacterium fujisawaense]MDH3031054.1 hypothetical protein [Methylobacterium fujisawaense]
MSSIIVDTNSIHKLFQETGVGATIWELIKNRAIQVPGGGTKYKDEVVRSPLREVFQELLRSGIIKLYSDEDIDTLEAQYKLNPDLKSDDQHVIAIAYRSGCRVLFSADKALSDDFKNHKILPKPRGKVLCNKYYAKIVQGAPPCKE